MQARSSLLLGLLFGMCGSAGAAEVEEEAPASPFTATYRLAPEGSRADTGRLFANRQTDTPARLLRQELELRGQGSVAGNTANLQTTLREDLRHGSRPETHGIVNQAYVDTPSRDGHAFTFGKKSVPWGVGFGFRPLDVVQRENRRQLNPPALVGIPQAAWEITTASTALTLLWQNPGQRWQAEAERLASPERDGALAAHLYQLDGDTDWHAVARYSDRYRLEAGAGFSTISGDNWVWHGALLRQQRQQNWSHALLAAGMPLLDVASPLRASTGGGANRAVAGVQWTADELSLLLEGWYDGSAPSRREWQALSALTAQQKALALAGLASPAAVDGNVGWSSQLLNRPNLHRDNLLLRLAWDRDQRWQAVGELLYHPADGGRLYTLSGSYKGDRQQLTLGWRTAAGAQDSMLRQTPLGHALWLEWRLALR